MLKINPRMVDCISEQSMMKANIANVGRLTTNILDVCRQQNNIHDTIMSLAFVISVFIETAPEDLCHVIPFSIASLACGLHEGDINRAEEESRTSTKQ